jgi:phosphoesterase RecJ-like protein
MGLKKVIASIKRNRRFLLTTHTNPEGDALGSTLAFYRLLKKLGKEAVAISDDVIPRGYEFLPDIDKIKRFRSCPGKNKNSAGDIKFDCLVALDCSDLARCGQVARVNAANKPIINVDHHISNGKFGEINWVEPETSSCSEMVYKLYKAMGVALDRKAALLLYTGILTDTGSFRYSNTRSFTHRAVSELLKYDLDVVRIYKSVYEDIPFVDMQLLFRILPDMRSCARGRIIWFQIGRKILKDKRLSFDLSEHVLSFGRAIKDAEVAVLFKENLGVKNEIRVNLRSQGKVDVNKIAKFFGGGGHKTASGITIFGTLLEVRKKVLAKIQQAIKNM